MFDTHCHLNFKAFKKNLPEIITSAQTSGVTNILVPGTDVITSKRAVEIVEDNTNIYAAVGIHPHHVYQYLIIEANSKNTTQQMIEQDMQELEALLSHKCVVAIGEVGMDRHAYDNTKYEAYAVDESFLQLQKTLLKKQIQLAVAHHKSLILHNREAKDDLIPLVQEVWSEKLKGKTVFHCCEPDELLLEFAKEHGMFIGVDGDITYSPEKQSFIKKVPLNMLVLETDSPFLLPEPLRTEKKYPNQPAHLNIIVKFIAELLEMSEEKLIQITSDNAQQLFRI